MEMKHPAAAKAAAGPLRIPESMVELIHGGNVMVLGTRNQKLAPSVVRVNGCIVGSGRDRITILLPGAEGGPAVQNLRVNGEAALLIMDPHTHSGYQFKGKYVEHHPAGGDETAVAEIHRSKLVGRLAGFYPKFDLLYGHYAPVPPVCVVIEVHEIYDQTPGPKAGQRVVVA